MNLSRTNERSYRIARSKAHTLPFRQKASSFARPTLWGAVLLFGIIEIVGSTFNAQLSIVLHACALVGLILYRTVLSDDDASQDFSLALCLVPLMRILSLVLPYDLLPKDAAYMLVSVPMLTAAVLTLRNLSQRNHALNQPSTHVRGIPAQVLLGLGGIVLGQIAFYGLPALLSKNLAQTVGAAPASVTAWLPLISTLVLVALAEELIFRGLIQATSVGVMGNSGVIFTALLYTVMGIGNCTPGRFPIEFIVMFIIALVLGAFVHFSGSLIGATLAHALLNVTTFVVLPLQARNPASPMALAIPFIPILCGLLAATMLVVFVLQKHKR